jgi:hypothetical protein
VVEESWLDAATGVAGSGIWVGAVAGIAGGAGCGEGAEAGAVGWAP